MKLHGVNLGGWLVLERWITPSLFKGLEARDETGFCHELGEKKNKKLQDHWSSWVTEKDFQWIASSGLNAVRIPVGHWIFGDVEPYVGSVEYLDWAMQQAEKNDLKVMIDLHGAPGSQNGRDHSGLAGSVGWHKSRGNIERSLTVIEKLSKRYCASRSLAGIEVLNEPSGVPKRKLLHYYSRSYEQVRKWCEESVMVIISDAFRPAAWQKQMNRSKYQNLALDCHLYQCFSEKDKNLSMEQHLKKTEDEWQNLISEIQRDKIAIIGEWSLGLDPKTFKDMDQNQKDQALKKYADAQLSVFSQAAGWFFWTYRTEDKSCWNFRHLVDSGVLNSCN